YRIHPHYQSNGRQRNRSSQRLHRSRCNLFLYWPVRASKNSVSASDQTRAGKRHVASRIRRQLPHAKAIRTGRGCILASAEAESEGCKSSRESRLAAQIQRVSAHNCGKAVPNKIVLTTKNTKS